MFFTPAIGASGGILCCWDKSVFVGSDNVVDQRFVAIKGHWSGSANLNGLVCVYASSEWGGGEGVIDLIFFSSSSKSLVGGILRILLFSVTLMRF